ncbi:MAG: diguanylate cyclase, partial [Sulfurimonadaceae bacterium]
GGEEFVVLLKDIDRDGAKKVVQSLIDAVANLKIEHKYSTVAEFVTISAGLSIKESDEDISKEDFLKIADDELYRAKESGRNKFCAKS